MIKFVALLMILSILKQKDSNLTMLKVVIWNIYLYYLFWHINFQYLKPDNQSRIETLISENSTSYQPLMGKKESLVKKN